MSLRCHFDELEIPPINSIFKCEVMNLQEYGAFLKIPGYRKNGLLHKQQISKNVVDNVSEVLSKGDNIWCKVISVGSPDEPKISLSMKLVDQGSGKDLDPNGVQMALDEKNRREHNPRGRSKIILEAVFNTVCKKCGTKGHLSQDCFNQAGSKSYELLADESDDDFAIAPPFLTGANLTKVSKKDDQQSREEKRKTKKPKKSSKTIELSSDDSDEDTHSSRDLKGKHSKSVNREDLKRGEKRKHKKHKKEKKHKRSKSGEKISKRSHK